MKPISQADIDQLYKEQKAFFASQKTLSVAFRKEQLRKLRKTILDHQNELEEAVWKDLRKSKEEFYITEINVVITEIDFHLKNVSHWSKPQRVPSPYYLFPGKASVYHHPYGTSLIISPWNYPFQLLINPLVGAISSGCTAILKPTPDSPHVSEVMQKMIDATFEPNYIALIQGDIPINEMLLQKPFDLIFFTGSSRVGKIIMKAAAEHLTPVVLELGGKSPCIVDEGTHVDTAAKRILWGKITNAGQTCVAPDYLLVHESVKEKLIGRMQHHLRQMLGESIEKSPYYGRIINDRMFDRLAPLLKEGRVRIGGQSNKKDLYIAPTVLDEVPEQAACLQEEIFGPILPVISFKNIEEALARINTHETPLAYYYFGSTRKGRKIIENSLSGGACINDTLLHLGCQNLPFGGVGKSGTGNYHGYKSFLAFTHEKGVFENVKNIDPPVRYAPFKYFPILKRLL
ncbi:MAG: aldehyde dehydrogenase family protein [Flavobacteriaceae bacterium]